MHMKHGHEVWWGCNKVHPVEYQNSPHLHSHKRSQGLLVERFLKQLDLQYTKTRQMMQGWWWPELESWWLVVALWWLLAVEVSGL